MAWVTVFVALAVATMGLLGVVGFRLWRDVRELGRTVASSSQRLAEAASALEAAANPASDEVSADKGQIMR